MDGRHFQLGQPLSNESFKNGSRHDQPATMPQQNSGRSSQSSTRGRNNRDGDTRISHDSKPRLSKDQQETLEKHFQEIQKPTTLAKTNYANALGVSLDKVNNWFQNRRAKVKQDQKKNLAKIHGPNYAAYAVDSDDAYALGADSSYIDPSFYQTIEAPPHQPLIMNDGLSMACGLPSNHQHCEERPHSATKMDATAGHLPMPPNEHVFNAYFGLRDAHSQNIDMNSFAQFSKQFGNQIEGCDPHAPNGQWGDPFDLSDPPSLGTQSSNNNSSVQLNSLSTEELHNSLPEQHQTRDPSSLLHIGSHSQDGAASVRHLSLDGAIDPNTGHTQFNSMGVPLTAQPHLSHPLYRNMEVNNISTPTAPGPPTALHSAQSMELRPSTSHHIDLHNQNHQPRLHHSFSEASLINRPTPQQGLSQLTPRPPIKEEETSAVSDESLNHKQTPSSRPIPLPRQSSNSGSFATRRQKRPPALGMSTTRSASYTSGSPAPQSGNGLHGASDTGLTRLKTSNGVINGRVQKSLASAQRSPLHLSFNEADRNRRAVRQASNASMDVANADQSMTATSNTPITPITPLNPSVEHMGPQDHIVIPFSDADAERSWSYMPNTAESSLNGSVWSRMPQTADTAPSYASSPHTPMDPGPMAGLHLHNAHQAQNFPVAHSAPPWQNEFNIPPQTWGETMMPPAVPAMAPEFRHDQAEAPCFDSVRLGGNFTPMPNGSRHHASHSMPVNGPMMIGFVGDQTTPTYQTEHPGSQMAQHHPEFIQQNHHQHSFRTSMHSDLNSNLVGQLGSPNLSQFKATSTSSSKSPPELQIQQWAPREPAAPEVLPPKGKGSHPRDFTFHHQGPASFSSPDSSTQG